MFSFIRKIISLILSGIISLGASASLWPYHPNGDKIDLSKFELVFSDEFDGNELSNVWEPHHFGMGDTVTRRGSYWNKKLAEVYGGNLHIKVKYLENGVNPGDPAGWYTAGIDTNGTFNPKYGYFEVRCILPAAKGLWSAFWLWSPGVNSSSPSGVVGSEIDVFESPYYAKFSNNMVSGNIHTRGYEENHKALGAKHVRVSGNPYNEYNTYGVEWNENEYIFYLNGQEWYRTNFDTPSQAEEFLILSVEVGGKDAVPDTPNTNFESEFIVDYVRAYQYKPA